MRSFDWVLKKSKFVKNMNEKLKSLAKKGPKATRTRDLLGKAWHESLKSELATAGAAIHPCIEIKQCYNIINWIFEFEKNARSVLHLLQSSSNPRFLIS